MKRFILIMTAVAIMLLSSCGSDDPSRYQPATNPTAAATTTATTSAEHSGASDLTHKSCVVFVDATSKVSQLPINVMSIAKILGVPPEECHEYSLGIIIATLTDVSLNTVQHYTWNPVGAGYENPTLARDKYPSFWRPINAQLAAIEQALQSTDKPSSDLYKGICQVLESNNISTSVPIIIVSDMVENSDIVNLYNDANAQTPTDKCATRLATYTDITVIYQPTNASQQALFNRAIKWWETIMPTIKVVANLH